MSKVRILGADFDALSFPQTVDAIFAALARGERGWLSTVNVAILMMIRSDPRLQNYVERSSLIVADGQPLVWCAPIFGGHLPERIAGVELIDAICARAAHEGRGIYLLGATAAVITQTADRLRQRHPDLRLDYADGYFSSSEAAARAERIHASGAEIVFVGMGVPRQERFIEDQWPRLGVGLAIGVGGSFDVLAGLRRRAPAWVQKIGMEWFFRLLQEPRRMFLRYLDTNTRFICLVAGTLMKRLLSR
ncbi:MAG: WecB/TagA/CpsF family glycosyltransferase [Proteobacteria bacterium]|nr:WecB/TagA/CpsF family glycosyltransferase [Pseudomonadota bacterium]HQR03436.1 WecB/TagA/CpsF family glycosyltransferase [Rhodocyclaceae bacterium]